MKRTLPLITLLALCSFGCATFERNANSAMGAMDIAVTVARAVWDAYAATGRADPLQEDKAELAFAAYQKAKLVFADAVQVYKNNPDADPVKMALDTLNYAAIDVVNLILLFVPRDAATILPVEARRMRLEEAAARMKKHGR